MKLISLWYTFNWLFSSATEPSGDTCNIQLVYWVLRTDSVGSAECFRSTALRLGALSPLTSELDWNMNFRSCGSHSYLCLSIQGQLIRILLATVGILQKSVNYNTFWFKLMRQFVSNEGICASNVYFNCKIWVGLEVRSPFQGNSWQDYKWMHGTTLDKLYTNWFDCYFIVTTLKWNSV